MDRVTEVEGSEAPMWVVLEGERHAEVLELQDEPRILERALIAAEQGAFAARGARGALESLSDMMRTGQDLELRQSLPAGADPEIERRFARARTGVVPPADTKTRRDCPE